MSEDEFANTPNLPPPRPDPARVFTERAASNIGHTLTKDAKHAWDETKEDIGSALSSIRQSIQNASLFAVLTALITGVIIGLLFASRRERTFPDRHLGRSLKHGRAAAVAALLALATRGRKLFHPVFGAADDTATRVRNTAKPLTRAVRRVRSKIRLI